MHELLQYMLKWSIALGVAFLFYRLVLRPLTFYQWNRRFLIMYSFVAFFIPFINLYSYVPEQQLQNSHLIKYIPAINITVGNSPEVTVNSSSWDPLLIIALVVAIGSIVLLVRLLMQWFSLKRIRSKAIPLYHPEANVYHVDDHVIPFSFGDAIYLNTALHSEEELHNIIMHEFVHVKQKHSFDIIWSEILCILNWYNPFAWCIRHAIRQNLEFIADQAVLNNGLDKKTYQYHLLKVIGSPQYSIANNFNFSSLKKRIAMMNRLKSARVHLVKFLFLLPLLAVLLVAFRQNEGWYKDIKSDTIITPEIVVLRQTESDDKKPATKRVIIMKMFYKNNPNVREVSWSADDELIVYLRNGKREVYELESKEDMQRFKEKYGQYPTVVQPTVDDLFALDMLTFPPEEMEIADIEPSLIEEPIIVEEPLIVDEPEVVELEEMALLEELNKSQMEAEVNLLQSHEMELRKHELEVLIQDLELQKFYKRNPQVQAIRWDNDNIIIIKKDGTKEIYDQTDKRDIQRFREKYGDLPAPPPPAPPSHPLPVEESALPEGVKSVEVVDNIMILRRHDGRKEVYDLSNPKEKAELEKKYGEVIELREVPKPPHNPKSVLPPQKPAPSKAKVVDHVLRIQGNPATVQVIDQKQGNPVLFADEIVIHGNEKDWYLKKQPKANPVYYINGKKSNQQNPQLLKEANNVSHVEVIADKEMLEELGIRNYNSIINIITNENVLNKSVYLSKESVKTIEKASAEGMLQNTLYIGIENPLNIKVEGVPDNELLVTMTKTAGEIREKNGRLYAFVTQPGNLEIKIYQRKSNGEIKLLKTRVFRAAYLPHPNEKLNTFNTLFPMFDTRKC